MRDVISITKSIIKINAIPIRIGFMNSNESEAKKTGKIRHVYQEIFQIVQRKLNSIQLITLKNPKKHFKNKRKQNKNCCFGSIKPKNIIANELNSM